MVMSQLSIYKEVDSLIHVLNTPGMSYKEKFDISEDITSNIIEYRDEIDTKVMADYIYGKTDKLFVSCIHNFIAGYYDSYSQYDYSLYHFEKAYEIGVECDDWLRQVVALINIANSYCRQSKYTKALEYNLQALELCERKDLKKGPDIRGPEFFHTGILANIAEIHLELKNYDRALYFLKQSDAIAGRDTLGVAQKKYILGSVYKELGSLDKALDNLLDARRMYGGGYATYCCYVAIAISGVYLKQENYVKALEFAEEGYFYAKKQGDPKLYSRSLNRFSNIYFKQHRWKECDAIASQAWSHDSTSLDIALNLLFNMAFSNIQLGNKQEVASIFLKHDSLKNLYIDKNYRETMIDMETQYETDKKELRISSLEREHNLYIWLGISGAVLILVFLSFFIVRHRLILSRKRLVEQQVTQLEQEKQIIAARSVIDGETAERVHLSRELHDGLGGMLTVIKLNLERGGHPNKIIDLVNQTEEELRRMVHHMMPESLFRFGLKTALEDFCLSIPNLKFHYYGEDKRFDKHVETVLYRCSNELINNAIKHSDASEINVQLIQQPDRISLTIQDDGCGFNLESVPGGMGFGNLNTRLTAYNGRMVVHSSPGHGTEIYIEVELKS